jgi:predicted DNA-binding protein (MmcQ/YjbR family)
MKRSDYEGYIEETYSVSGDRPFGDDQSILIFRHNDNKKWFGAVMTIPKYKLGLKEDGFIDVVNVKCAQDIIDSMWNEEGVYPAYHMNKHHWLSVALDGSANDKTVKFLTEISYDLTKTKLKKKNAPQI